MKKISIFVHSCEGTTGFDDELVNYLLGRNSIKNIIHIKFPFIRSQNGSIKLIKYDEVIVNKQSIIRFFKPELPSYIKDFIYSIFYGLKYAKNSDLFIGSPNLLALTGILLKQFGLVKKTVYYIIDYTPVRFRNSLLNSLYNNIDNFCCYHSDEVWTLNNEMLNGRILGQKLDRKKINSKIVPYGNGSDRSDIDHKKHNRFHILYFGGVSKNKGSNLFIPIVKELIKLDKVKFKLVVIGGGEYKELQKEVNKSKLTKYFEILGPISNMAKVHDAMISCGVGIAPYYPYDKNSFSYYADPGKVKDYLGCGLPVVITKVPPIWKKIVKRKAGIVSPYDPVTIANSINIITGKSYNNYKEEAIKLGKEYSWTAIFNKALKNL